MTNEKKEEELMAAPEPMRSDGITRRTLCVGGASIAALIAMGSLRYVGHNPLPRPPGGQDESHLVSACIRCERCYEVCPRQVIVPAHIEDGLLGMRTPTFNFDVNYCDFCSEENGGVPLCVLNCPTEALVLPEGATPENTIMGKAVIDQYQCLAFREQRVAATASTPARTRRSRCATAARISSPTNATAVAHAKACACR